MENEMDNENEVVVPKAKVKFLDVIYLRWVKLLVAAAVVACVMIGMSIFVDIVNIVQVAEGDLEVIIQPDYLKSATLRERFRSIAYDVGNIAFRYKDDNNIKNDGTLDYTNYQDSIYFLYNEKESNGFSDLEADERDLFIGNYQQDKDYFAKYYADEIKTLRDDYIRDEAANFYALMNQLSKSGVRYYALERDGVAPHLNFYPNSKLSTSDVYKEAIMEHKAYCLIENSTMTISGTKVRGVFYMSDGYYSYRTNRNGSYSNARVNFGEKVYIALDDDEFEKSAEIWSLTHESARQRFINMTILLLIALAGIVLLGITAGRKSRRGELCYAAWDKVYPEVQAALAVAAVAWIFVLAVELYNSIDYGYDNFYYVMLYFAFALSAAVTLAIYTSLIRLLKGGKFFRSMVSVRVLLWLLRSVGRFFKGIAGAFTGSAYTKYPLAANMRMRHLIFVIAEGIVVILFLSAVSDSPGGAFFMMLIGLAIFIAYIYGINKTIADMTKLVLNIEQVRGGKYGDLYPISEKSQLYAASESLSKVSEGIEQTVRDKVKAERMKVELVANISHDLKTPLTSIISYAELLAKEEGLPKHVEEYAHVLSAKSQRLKVIIEDLFTIAKATSGNIVIEAERLDFTRLLKQTLADMEEAIATSGLIFKTDIPEAPVYIYSDGKKMYRVFQNLIVNAIKYSLHGTRVYVSLTTDGVMATASIKNTANYEMNFNTDEITERFTRGDSARSTEGNGLGLSIAKSFTEGCGGTFKVRTDADLFTASVTFGLCD